MVLTGYWYSFFLRTIKLLHSSYTVKELHNLLKILGMIGSTGTDTGIPVHNRRVRGITVQALEEKTYNRYVPVLNKRAKKKSKNCKQKGGDKNH